VGTDPVLQFLTRGGFGVGVVAGSQDGDEDRSLVLRTALRVIDGDRVPSIIHKELLTRLVFLAQHHIQVPPPLLVELTEAAVGVAIRMGLAILLPRQLERQVGMALEFFVKTGKIRGRLAALIGTPWSGAKQGLLQPPIIPALG
jgi:hypothetical protein